MVKPTSGNILDADVEALVNTVNTVGVMGKGIALQFRQAFPGNYDAYLHACKRGEVKAGRMFVYRTNRLENPRFIINFPTKRHWKQRARIKDIESGLRAMVEVIRKEKIRSIAIPPLGSGSGQLDWKEVRPRIEETLSVLPDVDILLFEPSGAPPAEGMVVRTRRPKMTTGRAAIISLMQNYGLPGYRLTLLEVQKLAYFLQEAGEPLRLGFVKGKYGPYADTLEHVFQRIEGHFTRGYGDRSRGATIRLIWGATEEAAAFLRDAPGTRQRLERVSSLIEGFETPYGMELLATIHWVAKEGDPAKSDVAAAVEAVQSWSEHKRRTFPSTHLKVAWEKLREQRWL